MFRKVPLYFHKLLTTFCLLLISLMTGIVIINVINRYVLNVTFAWVEELVTQLFIASFFFGAVWCVYENQHIKIDAFIAKTPGWFRNTIGILENALIITIMVFLIRGSLEWIDKLGRSINVPLQMEVRYLYIIVPISFTLIILYTVAIGLKPYALALVSMFKRR